MADRTQLIEKLRSMCTKVPVAAFQRWDQTRAAEFKKACVDGMKLVGAAKSNEQKLREHISKMETFQ